ncbi:hypothetical protein M3Y99_00844700 [Aphelenchoides fujianensis]|nr:hypothetical protein M3Y99_00844700 [Aphelenchoides fujianensis]
MTSSVVGGQQKEVLGQCLICGEDSFGKHYGCPLACLGCKTFFRRAVIHKQDTLCKKPGVCVGETSARRLCRSCRYKKCLEMGMVEDALQPRRDVIGRRRRPVVQQQQTAPMEPFLAADAASTSNSSLPSEPIDSDNELLDLIANLTEKDILIRERKFALIRSRMEAKRLADLIKDGKETSNQERQLNIMLGSDIASSTEFDGYQTIPCFVSLPIGDRLTLLKNLFPLIFFPYHYLEHGYYTAQKDVDDVWLISNGTCMPRSVECLPQESAAAVAPDRKWRQQKLYQEMTDRCIDEVVLPLRRLNLLPEELVCLKIIMLFHSYSNHDDASPDITDESRHAIWEFKNRTVTALFHHYRKIGYTNYEERFGNVVLTISGFVSAAGAMLESYQVMRVFGIVPFDRISEQLLFDMSE